MSQVVPGPDGRPRCAWPGMVADEQYLGYHDQEWGRPVTNDTDLFERISLEAFQSGLSWLTILRKRENFRAAFAGFDPVAVAAFTEADEQRLLQDAGIIRNRAKISATIANARALLDLPAGESLLGLFEAHRPAPRAPHEPVPAQTTESAALARALKKRGFRFVGPTTSYAAMQAIGMVNDHQQQCWVRPELDAALAAERQGRP